MNNMRRDPDAGKSFWRWLAVITAIVSIILIIGWFQKSPSSPSKTDAAGASGRGHSDLQKADKFRVLPNLARNRTTGSAEEQVATRLAQYTKNRRALIHRYAEKAGFIIPAAMEQFLDAAEAGNSEEMKRLGKLLRDRKEPLTAAEREALKKLSPIIQEMMGVYEQAREWPAQDLLDYGKTVLGSLKPGMVYIGGTDPGRFIPTLLNETGPGQPGIVLTQNAFADNSYLEYIHFLYGDRLTSLNPEDSQKSFQNYLDDARRRLAHDKQFPDEPKQVRPGEEISEEGGRIMVSGQVAVMSINEALLQALLQKNPNLSFAMEESFSLPSTYKGSTTLGPLIGLNSGTSTQPLTVDDANAAMNYWGEVSGRVLASSDPAKPSEAAHAYEHMLVAQGNLFADQNFSAQAEQAYRLAHQLWPDDSEAVHRLATILSSTGRVPEANQLLSTFALTHHQ